MSTETKLSILKTSLNIIKDKKKTQTLQCQTQDPHFIIYLKVTSGTVHLTPLWKGCLREMVWLV